MLSFSAATSPCRFDGDRAGEVALGDGRRDFGDGADLRGEIGGEAVDVVGQVAPGARGAGDVRLPAELALRCPPRGRRVVTCSANVASVSVIALIVSASSAISPLASNTSFCFRSPLRDGGDDLGDAAHLARQVRGHRVDVVGQVLPRAGDVLARSACPPSFPSVPTSRATRVTSDANALSWSTIVLMVSFSSRISPFTSTVIFFDRSPFATAVVTAAMLRTWLVRLLAMKLTLSVRSFHVPETPRTCACPPSWPSVPTSRGDARHLGRERVELVDHRVDGVLQLEDLAAHVDRDLLRQVAVRDGGGDGGDVAHLAGEVAGHVVDAVGQVLPRAGDALDLRLPAQLALGADLARDARHFGREAR